MLIQKHKDKEINIKVHGGFKVILSIIPISTNKKNLSLL